MKVERLFPIDNWLKQETMFTHVKYSSSNYVHRSKVDYVSMFQELLNDLAKEWC